MAQCYDEANKVCPRGFRLVSLDKEARESSEEHWGEYGGSVMPNPNFKGVLLITANKVNCL